MTEAEKIQQDYFQGKCNYGSYGMPLLSSMLCDAPRADPAVPGYHILMTAPRIAYQENSKYSMHRYELLTMQLSARTWRRYNGPIHLITDSEGEEFIRYQGLDQEYMSIRHLPHSLTGINTRKFWAAGKIAALSDVKTPCAIIDLDLIVWRPLPLSDCRLAVAHIEHLNERYYPPKDHFLMSPRYQFPLEWDSTVKPLNTAFLYLDDEKFRDTFTLESMRFMRNERDTPDDGSVCMIFAEQRILAMCAKSCGLVPKLFVDYDNLLAPQEWFTHLWVGKRFLDCNEELQNVYCEMCEEKISEISTA